MNKEIYHLLSILLRDEDDRELWLNGYNHAFGMSPLKMMSMGRQEEVFSYLHFAVYGPY